IPKPKVAKHWDHLACIAEELMPYRKDVEVGMLIGTNCVRAVKPREVIPGKDDDPYGIRTELGWGIVGRVCKQVMDAREAISPAQVREMFERYFHERVEPKSSQSLSVDDKKFLKKLEDGIHKRDGHYGMPLPLRCVDAVLPNNRSQALRRLAQLKVRLRREHKFRKDYTDFMEKTLKNCAEKVTQESHHEGRINYVVHHGVYHPQKPDKIRVVFDCSAHYEGTSLNKNLLNGPKFLWKPGPYQTSTLNQVEEVNSDDPEVQKTTALAKAVTESAEESKGKKSKQSSDHEDVDKNSVGPITLEELRQAEIAILRSVQQEHTHKQEIQVLSSLDVKGEFLDRQATKLRNANLKKCSSLYRLDPYLDDDGLLRVGGRLRRANLEEELKHPVILPRQAHITQIIVRHYHLATKHQGRGEVRQRGFWEIG
ncbi:hypothetical protein QZH41_009490, partial [Actinostola sp. cb2023]